MKIQLKDKIESAHQWIDSEGKRHQVVIVADKGDVLDSAAPLPVASATAKYGVAAASLGDAERALKKLVTLGHAAEIK